MLPSCGEKLYTLYHFFCQVLPRLTEKAMASHSSTLAWKIPWTEEPGGLQSMWLQRVGHDWGLYFHFSLSCTGEGNGNPLQCSCLENPRDGGAWGLLSMGLHRVGHDWSHLAAAATARLTEPVIIHSLKIIINFNFFFVITCLLKSNI